jgi:hypothetical protein
MEKILAVMAVIIRKEDPTAVISSVFDGSYIDDESRELCRQFVCAVCPGQDLHMGRRGMRRNLAFET